MMGELSVRIVIPIDMKKLCALSGYVIIMMNARMYTHPKVADDATIYCPRVLSMPFGPGPKRIIFVAPKMKPIMSPTAVCDQYNTARGK